MCVPLYCNKIKCVHVDVDLRVLESRLRMQPPNWLQMANAAVAYRRIRLVNLV